MTSCSKGKTDWSSEQLELLRQLEPKFKSKKWKHIAAELRKQGYNRSEIQCREKWINFLDPKANKKKWEEWELRHLYDAYGQVGTRWCLIQKELNRTQNSIKNRFYGTLRNYIRFVLGYFDSSRTCYNIEISKLTPKFMTDLYGSINSFQFMKGQAKNTIYEMGFILDKKIMAEKILEHRPLYHRLNQLIFQAFEEIAVSSKGSRQIISPNAATEESDNQQIENEEIEEENGAALCEAPVLEAAGLFPECSPSAFVYPIVQWLPYQTVNPVFCWYL